MFRKKKNAAQDERLNRIEEQLKMLECPHKRVEFGFSLWGNWVKRCLDCGKTLEVYENKEAFLVDKLAHAAEVRSEEIASIKDEMKALRAEKGGK